MQKLLQLTTASIVLLSLQACMTPIGKPEFTCPNQKKGGVCAGPRDIYELTNNRENLNDLAEETKNAPKEQRKSTFKTTESGEEVVVYHARELSQHGAGNYQRATVVSQEEFDNPSRDGFDAFPGNGEPLAPEPLAIVNPAKVMRILVASYTDAQNRLNMPGYVFVQVQEQSFSVGEAANLRPTRVVPLEVRSKSQEEEKRQQQRSRGVSPLEVMSGGGK